MRFLHLSDLHIGRKLNGFSLLDDQKHILRQSLELMDKYLPDAVIIAGDVYDSAAPPVEAVTTLDWFLTRLLDKNKPVFIVSGNHDSPERLSFGSDIMRARGLHIAGIFRGEPELAALSDGYGKLNVYMLPFIKPAHVNTFYGEKSETFDAAVRYVLKKTKIDTAERNILIAHQFVTAKGANPERTDSETKYAGGLDNVDVSAFREFDYVALGHLHSPQLIGDNAAYSGSPLKYSVSERFQNKCAVLVDVLEKGSVVVERLRLAPLRDLRQIKGSLEELLAQPESDDYVSVILTDDTRRLEPYKRLREVYRNCVSVEYADDNAAASDMAEGVNTGSLAGKSHIEIFEEFYSEMNGGRFDNADIRYLNDILDEIADGEC